VETSGRLYRFAGALEGLLAAPDAEAFERAWQTAHVDRLAWEALGSARRADSEALEPALDQVDRRLLAMLERCRAFPDPHVITFRVPEVERWQHAAAAALVGARWGVAGLRTVIADTGAPLGRRYFLANWEMDKNVYSNGIFTVKLGPFLDSGRITDPSGLFGSRQWLWDTGAQCKVRVLGSITVVLIYGRDLRSGRNVFYGTVLR